MTSDFHQLVESINSGLQRNGNAPLNASAYQSPQERQLLELCYTIGKFVGAQVKPLRERIEQLEAKIANFEDLRP